MAPRLTCDWNVVREAYQNTDQAIRAIARGNNCSEAMIRKKAKDEKWVRIGDLEYHIEIKAKHIAEVRSLERKEVDCALSAQQIVRINEKVLDRVNIIEACHFASSRLMNKLMGMLEHDAAIIPMPGQPIDPAEYGKIKLASDVINNTKKLMIGDSSLADLHDSVNKNEEDLEEWAIVVPSQEVERIAKMGGNL